MDDNCGEWTKSMGVASGCGCKELYHRSDFDCEILLIANCEYFHNSQSKESQEKEYAINNILPAWQFAIIKITIWLI